MGAGGADRSRSDEGASADIDLDLRRRRARYRAWHRGTREMDLILGPFADAALPDMGEGDLAAFEALLEVPDGDLYLWVTGGAPPAEHDGQLLRRLREFHEGPVGGPR